MKQIKKMNKMEIIRRNIEIRAAEAEDSRLIEGCAVIFNSWSRDLGGFQEIIRSSAITQDLVDNSDVIMNVNHDNNQLVARWKRGSGTLKLELKEDGLYFSFEAPQTERGNELLWNVRNGNLYECSFAFSLPANDTCQNWYRDGDGTLRREITEIGGLYDCAIVTVAAYPATSVDARSENIDIEAIKRSLDEKEEEEKREVDEAQKAETLNKLDERIKNFLEKINI